MRQQFFSQFVLLLAACCSCGIDPVDADDVTIRIVGPGGRAQYIEDGETQQKPVAVNVGDIVYWRNEGHRDHTATAENGDDGRPVFDTLNIDRGTTSIPVEMSPARFKAAGGHSGGTVTIDYFCDYHPPMQSSLILSDRATAAKKNLNRRRDITSLNSTELRDYRDAWRRIQRNGEYSEIAGYHGCPRRYCHQDARIFLPWHREFVLGMEFALGQPVHYWDWTSPDAVSFGIPRAFTDIDYVAADGRTYPNPLFSFLVDCNGIHTTSRNPRSNSLLGGYAAEVRIAYGSTSYARFNQRISRPHGSLHTWVRGDMFSTVYAAYDPVFWAHHSNVDRQWASWQAAGGADPTSSERRLRLTGFTGRTVDDVKAIAPLGYDYDRYDRAFPSAMLLAGQSKQQIPRAAGVGKTFEIPAGIRAMTARANVGPLDLYVSGLAEHPAESCFVYVFVNQPDATPEDALPANPDFAGTFGVFGGSFNDESPLPAHENLEPRRVLQLFSGRERPTGQVISSVTFVVTDETDAIVSPDSIPFVSVRIRPAGNGQTGAGTVTTTDSIACVPNVRIVDDLTFLTSLNAMTIVSNTARGGDYLVAVVSSEEPVDENGDGLGNNIYIGNSDLQSLIALATQLEALRVRPNDLAVQLSYGVVDYANFGRIPIIYGIRITWDPRGGDFGNSGAGLLTRLEAQLVGNGRVCDIRIRAGSRVNFNDPETTFRMGNTATVPKLDALANAFFRAAVGKTGFAELELVGGGVPVMRRVQLQ